ncbi:MAG TPA: GntR family transcriptional regulator [Candidatus Pullilachnospira intestinigallinarum]|nr:GntR family transcriptional regulator [Candidatus Pullilachnospira intestinigallinarum]
MKQRQTLKEQIYKEIIDGIVSGEFKSEQILNEQALVERYHVSKAPVREALLILSSEGILENIPRYGYRVVSFTRDTVNEIMEFRSALEDHVLIKSFLTMRPEDLEALRELISDDARDDSNVWQHWDRNMDFHLRLAAMADNKYIYRQLKTAMNFLKLAYAQFYWSHWNRTAIPNDLKNHIRIIEALEEKDLDLARLYLKQDLKDFCME